MSAAAASCCAAHPHQCKQPFLPCIPSMARTWQQFGVGVMAHRCHGPAAERVFEDFEPAVEWKLAGEEQDVVEISLPGFHKDQVRVQLDNHGVLRATGECPTRGGRWARFKKDLRLPNNCDSDGARARFKGEKLIIMLPIVAVATTAALTDSVAARA
ncbi:unnamed protein product [Miscanthus lutarioriparius]|uniref:SHSP domain-containing protein n=1 Tax=Miscanthus lutarioriparius TaxID=422564 RepID=A0A811R9T8_9POAL|nr:unnamed protein product [Miscanthus lutarioriparius]